MLKFFELNIWNTAFRPFFWFGSMAGIILIGLWLGVLKSLFPVFYMVGGIEWHSYEMVFGFTRAIVIGFLFTAVQNWTNSTILRGQNLSFLLSLWILGRFAFFLISRISFIFFTMDIVVDILIIYYLYPKLTQENQKHNYTILVHFTIFTFFHIVSGLALLSIVKIQNVLHWIHASIFSILFLIQIIAGRVVPFFTSAVTPGYSFQKHIWIENILEYLPYIYYFLFFYRELVSLLSISSIIARESIWKSLSNPILSLLMFAFFLLNGLRFLYWKPWFSRTRPILWILYLGYFWLCLGFLTYGLQPFGWFGISQGIHLFTLGAIGVFVYGMITRVSLGHTGRALVASPWIVLGYILLNLAVVFRVVLPSFGMHSIAYFGSGLSWILAFSMFLINYTKILFTKRPDGKSS